MWLLYRYCLCLFRSLFLFFVCLANLAIIPDFCTFLPILFAKAGHRDRSVSRWATRCGIYQHINQPPILLGFSTEPHSCGGCKIKHKSPLSLPLAYCPPGRRVLCGRSGCGGCCWFGRYQATCRGANTMRSSNIFIWISVPFWYYNRGGKQSSPSYLVSRTWDIPCPSWRPSSPK